MRKILATLLSLVMVLSLSVPAAWAEEPKSDDIVILYTNDVHCHIDGDVSYPTLAGLKNQLKEQYNNVLLLDAGDHAQGTAYGSMDKGETVIKLMNAAKYDAATLGNHEFDYDQEGRINITDKWAEFPYVSCNFHHEKDGVRGENVLDSYVMFDMHNGKKLAVVGVTTPESFTKSTPAYFQDDNGNYIYGISGGTDGSELYKDVQTAIDAAKAEGADYVIGLGHLGVDKASTPWTSEDVIANTSGLTAMVDGHSHTAVEGRMVKDKDGNDVMLSQTKCYFAYIGKMVIDAETGAITTQLLSKDDLADVTPDPEVAALNDAWVEKITTQLGEKIGHTDLVFDNFNEEGLRLVRSRETNTGDFAADALYYKFDQMGEDVDVALMNGGGVRNTAITGDLSYLTCKEIHTFGNEACLMTVTGQQLLDALEWGARSAAEDITMECGGFQQVSGVHYSVDTTVPSTVQMDEKGVWTGGPTGEYRVKNVTVYDKETKSWEPLDLAADYNIAGYNYTLRNMGDGFAMFDGARVVQDRVTLDYMILAEYIRGFENGEVMAENSPLNAKYDNFGVNYANVASDSRISILTESTPVNPDKPDVKPDEKPDVKPDEKPDVKPDETPDVKPDEKPIDKPDVKPETPDEKPATPNTGDNGVMMYAGLGALAVLGAAAMLRKKKEQC